MREYEIYIPKQTGSGKAIEPATLERVKQKLIEVFGGYTHFDQRLEGAWRVGSAVFYDEITIVRVLDDENRAFDIRALKNALETELEQKEMLIVTRSVETI